VEENCKRKEQTSPGSTSVQTTIRKFAQELGGGGAQRAEKGHPPQLEEGKNSVMAAERVKVTGALGKKGVGKHHVGKKKRNSFKKKKKGGSHGRQLGALVGQQKIQRGAGSKSVGPAHRGGSALNKNVGSKEDMRMGGRASPAKREILGGQGVG